MAGELAKAPEMGRKLRRDAVRIRRSIEVGTFDEHDVQVLLTGFREHASKGTPVRELGDFIAHREKVKGTTHRYVCQIREAVQAVAEKRGFPFSVGPAFNIEALKSSIDEHLTIAGAETLRPEHANSLMTCAMSLLQDVTLLDTNRSAFGKLNLGYSTNKIMLFANMRVPGVPAESVGFALLEAPNTFMPNVPPTNWFMFGGPMYAHCEQGQFMLTPA